jgi:transcription antitermination factor NusG
MIRWYALRAKPNCERKLMRRINDIAPVFEGEPRPAEAIAPMERVESKVLGKTRIRVTPIIRGYVFVGMMRPCFAACRTFPEAGSWMGVNGAPKELPYRSIERLMAIERELDAAARTRTNRHLFAPGHKVIRTLNGVRIPGTVVCQIDDDVNILVSMLGKLHAVKVRAKELEAA